jgi:hypothetical protein
MEESEIRMAMPSNYIQIDNKKYRPSKQECLSQYELNIVFMSRGCVVRVGCKSIAFSDTDHALAELQKYFENPYESQEEWRKLLS